MMPSTRSGGFVGENAPRAGPEARATLLLLFAGWDNDFGRLRPEAQRDIDQCGLLAVFILDLQLQVPGRRIEQGVALRVLGGLDRAEVADPLRHAGAVADLGVG